LQAPFNRLPHQRFDLRSRRVADVAFAGDPHTSWQPAGKGFTDDLFGLAVTVARSEVDQVDASSDGGMDRGHAFIESRLAPHHPEPAPAQGQARHRRKPAEPMLLHQRHPS